MSNFDALAKHARYLRTVTLPYFKMYSLGEYPYVVRSENPDDTIVAELFLVDDEKTEQTVNHLESDAGYILEPVIIAEEKFEIFVFTSAGPDDPQIRSGDWVQFVREFDF